MMLFTMPQLRDFYAASALQGYLAAHADSETALPPKPDIARYAFALADEMLAQRGNHAEANAAKTATANSEK